MRPPFIEPAAITINDFLGDFSREVEATRLEQLMILYEEYRRLSEDIEDFDHFVFWGDMLITDFNDVDKYLVDAGKLFSNVKNLREINSTYLTEDQRAIILQYWGEEKPEQYIEEFWTHIHQIHNEEIDSLHETKAKFLKLWEVLEPLYHNFRSRLMQQNKASQGMMYRNAVDSLRELSADSLPFERYIFVGFNVLSTSELRIFSLLRDIGRGDFYWDANSPVLDDRGNKAGRFIRRNMKDFASRYPLPEKKLTSMPSLQIIGLPSNAGQTKEAGTQLLRWLEDGTISNRENAINTAIVLPDEQLFLPMIHSVPAEITNLNVTMGFPMKFSPIASLMKLVIHLQLHSKPEENGAGTFFYEDVKALLLNPIIREISPIEVDGILDRIDNDRLYDVPSKMFTDSPLVNVFTSVTHPKKQEGVFIYLINLVEFLIERTPEEGEELRKAFLLSYKEATIQLRDACQKYQIEMKESTLFNLVERMMAGAKVNFEGQPLRGLQIMGVLETRGLDFDNIIILSMNERVFPRNLYTSSFIPDALRRGYGMSTLDFQESIFGYYFYRLISRAKEVVLIYDARTSGLSSGEQSRYIAQLLYLYPHTSCVHKLKTYPLHISTLQQLSVVKTSKVMERLNRYFDPESGCRLSASSLNDYIACPLRFYLKYVEDYSDDSETVDYIDTSLFGSIVHNVMQDFYTALKENNPSIIQRETLDTYAKLGNPTIVKFITRNINRYYHKKDAVHQDDELKGESLVMSKVAEKLVVNLLDKEKDETPFTFIEAEKKCSLPYDIGDGRKVTMTLIIDRIDRKEGKLKFIDYKTGGDVPFFRSVESLFDGEEQERPKAVFQLILYYYLYNLYKGSDEAIKPYIYKFREVEGCKFINSIQYGSDKKSQLEDYHEVIDEFKEHLDLLLQEIFNEKTCFDACPSEEHCKYCHFKPLCGQ